MRRSQLFGGGGAGGRNGGGGGPGEGGNGEDAKARGKGPEAGPAPIGWFDADMKRSARAWEAGRSVWR